MKLTVKNLRGGYKDNFVMSGISLEIPKGCFFGIIGPNGSGKSTLLKLICGILQPQEGDVYAGEECIKDMEIKRKAQVFSYLPAESPLNFPFTVFETVLMGRNPYHSRFSSWGKDDSEKALAAMEKVEITDLKDRPVGSLSSGERQKVMLARAICQEPKVMLLDEPASHLDIYHQRHIFDILREINLSGVTVVAVFHDLNLVSACCEKAAAVKNGKLHGKPENPDTIVSGDFLKKLYGVDVRVEKVKGKTYILP